MAVQRQGLIEHFIYHDGYCALCREFPCKLTKGEPVNCKDCGHSIDVHDVVVERCAGEGDEGCWCSSDERVLSGDLFTLVHDAVLDDTIAEDD